MGWDPIGDIQDAGDWVGDTFDDIWEGITGEEAAKGQARLAKVVAAKNAELVFEAGVYERGALRTQAARDLRTLEDSYLQKIESLRTDISNAKERTEAALSMEGTALDVELSGYEIDYQNISDKVDAQRNIAKRETDTALTGALGDINLAYDVTMGRAEFDLNRELLAAELLASQDIEQAELTRETVEQKAGTVRDIKAQAALLSASYRTGTELAKSIYTMKRTVAAVQAKSGASGFSGESINLVAEDTKNFFQGQVDALQDNIASELRLSLYSSNSNYRDTVTSARETEALAATQALERLYATGGIAEGAYAVTVDTAEATRLTGTQKAFSTWDTDTLNYQESRDVNLAIAERTRTNEVEGVTALYEGKVDSLNMEYDILRNGKGRDINWLVNEYVNTSKYINESVEREINWSTLKSDTEMDIAKLGGQVTASSIMNQQRQAAWQRGAQVISLTAALV